MDVEVASVRQAHRGAGVVRRVSLGGFIVHVNDLQVLDLDVVLLRDRNAVRADLAGGVLPGCGDESILAPVDHDKGARDRDSSALPVIGRHVGAWLKEHRDRGTGRAAASDGEGGVEGADQVNGVAGRPGDFGESFAVVCV